jgi:hypothetical protein
MHPGFIPKNHPNATKKRGVDDSIDDRETPPCIWIPLDAEFKFTLDAAANHHNAKCDRYCTLTGTFYRRGRVEPECMGPSNGLERAWCGETVWCNPPFSGVRPWVEKAWDETSSTVVLLLPNNRAEQPFWQNLIEPYRDRPGSILTTRNLPKRRPFLYHGTEIGNRTSKNPPFGCLVVIWDRRRPQLPNIKAA